MAYQNSLDASRKSASEIGTNHGAFGSSNITLRGRWDKQTLPWDISIALVQGSGQFIINSYPELYKAILKVYRIPLPNYLL